MNITSGMSYEDLMDEKKEKWYMNIGRMILGGRKLMGEPEDFNF